MSTSTRDATIAQHSIHSAGGRFRGDSFDVGALAARDHSARGPSVPFQAAPIRRSRPVHFQQREKTFGALSVVETTLANWVGTRSAAHARASSPPRLVVAVGVADAHAQIEQNGREVVAGTSSVVAFWSVEHWTVRAEKLQTLHGLSVPLDAVGLPHLLVRDILVRDLSAIPLAGLFAHHLDGLTRLEAMSATTTRAVERVTVELLQALLSAAAGDDLRSGGSSRKTLGARIMLHLRTHLTDPTLSPASVADAFGISRRYLYLVMSEFGPSFAHIVRHGRLQRAADTLQDPLYTHVSIGAIGRATGFADQSTFSRAFRVEYGHTPSQWRRAATRSAAYESAAREASPMPSAHSPAAASVTDTPAGPASLRAQNVASPVKA